jgi:hypothetical protein
MGPGVFVPLDRPAFGDLTAPTTAAQHLPDVCRVIADPEFQPNHGREALQGPQLVGEAIGHGAFQ